MKTISRFWAIWVFLGICLLGQVSKGFGSFGYYSVDPNRFTPTVPAGPTPIPPPPIPPNVPIDPALMTVVLQNITGFPDSEVFVMTFGKQSGKQGYLDIDTMTGVASFTVASETTFSSDFSFPFSDLPSLDSNSRYFQVPQPFESARMYFAIRFPIILQIGKDSMTGDSTIQDPDTANFADPNQNTLYDKLEFTYNAPPALATNANLFINPTAVDFFTLPLTIQVVNPVPSGQDTAGLPFKRSDIYAYMQEVFDRFDVTSDKVWNDLYINFVEDPFKPNSKIITTLRVSAPAKSSLFPLDYLDNFSRFGFSYVDNIWNFYQKPGNQLRINALEIKTVFGPGTPDEFYFFTGTAVSDNLMRYVNDTGDFTWEMKKPTGTASTKPFFGGAGFMDSGEANGTPGAIIVRQFTSAFDVGILPETFSGNNFMDKAYFESQKSRYYTPNANWGLAGTENGPFYDLYSKSIHTLGKEIYTFAFDDELGQDGTQTGNTEIPQDSFPVVVLYSIDNPIPDPFDDPTTDYTVTFSFAMDNPVSYRQGTAGAFIPATINTPVPNLTSNATTPLQIKIINAQTSMDEILTVYLKYSLVIPGSTNFAAAFGTQIEQTSAKGFTITTGAAGP